MNIGLSGTLVVGIAATLFYPREAEAGHLAAGLPPAHAQSVAVLTGDDTGMAVVRALLGLNRFQPPADQRALASGGGGGFLVQLLGYWPAGAASNPRTVLLIVRHTLTGRESVVEYL